MRLMHRASILPYSHDDGVCASVCLSANTYILIVCLSVCRSVQWSSASPCDDGVTALGLCYLGRGRCLHQTE